MTKRRQKRNPDRDRILSLLNHGVNIRRIDGRYALRFVDLDALEGLIADGCVEVFRPSALEIEMVRAKAQTQKDGG